tara:strand:- start:40 stop:474 length:435 start_codon:yes stop_codon:yes gene_type:complete
MILISHRGNMNGINKKLENEPNHLQSLSNMGIDVEVDVWFDGEQLFLGHDEPEHKVDLNFLQNDKFWCHAKNLLALEYMLENKIHCFWHQSDDYTLTSNGIIWTYPNRLATSKCVIVCNTFDDTEFYANLNILGVCSDYIGEIK